MWQSRHASWVRGAPQQEGWSSPAAPIRTPSEPAARCSLTKPPELKIAPISLAHDSSGQFWSHSCVCGQPGRPCHRPVQGGLLRSLAVAWLAPGDAGSRGLMASRALAWGREQERQPRGPGSAREAIALSGQRKSQTGPASVGGDGSTLEDRSCRVWWPLFVICPAVRQIISKCLFITWGRAEVSGGSPPTRLCLPELLSAAPNLCLNQTHPLEKGVQRPLSAGAGNNAQARRLDSRSPFLTALEDGSPGSRGQQVWFLSVTCRWTPSCYVLTWSLLSVHTPVGFFSPQIE